MAKQEIPIKITVDTNDAEKGVEKLKKGVDDTGKSAKNAGEAAKKSTSFFGGLGGAIKALGVVSIIAGAFGVLKDALFKNQKVADTFAAVTGTIASLMTQLIDIVTGVIDRVSKSTNGFDALGKVMKGLLTLALTPIKVVFFEIKLAIEVLQLAWEKSFFGKGDEGRIKELTANIKATKDSLIGVGKDAINAGKDIATNFVDAAKSIGDVVTGTIEGVKKIDVAATFEQQKAIAKLKNSAELAAATLAGLVEKYDRQAEQQRQIRDDETKSIDDRIKANNKLGKILDKQRKAQLAQAQAILSAAQAEANADKENIQLQKAVIEAKNNVAAVEAQITGLLSEQKVNAVGLAKIKNELGKQEAQATNQRLLNEQKAAAELIKNENDKLAAKKKIFEEESKIELARLQGNVDAADVGTEARIAAEIELANKKSELAIQGQQLDRQILETGLNTQLEQINKQKEIYQLDFDARKGFLEQEKLLLDEQLKNNLITKEKYLEDSRNITAQENQLEMDKLNQKKAITDQIIGLFGAETNVGRAALVIKQVLAAQEMIMEAKKTITFGKLKLAESTASIAAGTAKTAAIGFPQNIPMLIGYALQAAGIIMAIKQAVSGIGKAAGGGIDTGGANVTAPVSPTPSPQVTATQVNTAAVNQLGNQATRAYVLNSDIQNNDQRNAYINRNASIGNP